MKRGIRCCLVGFLVACATTVLASQKMNVLFLVVDDLNTWLLSDPNRYTGKVIAPNIQRLASEGMLFTHNYCAAPKCSPSRTSTLSGVAPWVSGVYQNSQTPKSSTALQKAVELRKFFQDNGYYVATTGKVGHGWDSPDFTPDAGTRIGSRDEYPPNAPLSPTGGGEQDWGPSHIPEPEMNEPRHADFTIEQLQKKHDKPFFLACGFFHPHMPWYVPQRYLDMYPLDDIVLPPLKDDDLDDVPERGKALGMDRSSVYTKAVAAGVYKNAIQGYLASTTFSDAQVGRILDALEKSPYKDNTLVVLWSDNGFHLGEKMHWQKGTMWEQGTHTLLMFKVPGMTKSHQVCDRFVSLLDIYPTLVEICGLPNPPQPLSGTSLVPLLKDPNHDWKNASISGYTEKAAGAEVDDVYLCVRTEKYRYINYGDGTEEFYDCSKDPHEWTNLAGNPEYKQLIAQHKAMLPQPAAPVGGKVRGKKDDDDQSQKKKEKKKGKA